MNKKYGMVTTQKPMANVVMGFSKRESLNNINSNENLSSIDRKKDTIPSRIQTIKGLLDGKNLDLMVNFDNTETENFIYPSGYKDSDSGDSSRDSSLDTVRSTDSRYILNKKMHDFRNIIKQIGGKLCYIKSGTSGHTFKGIINNEDGTKINYAVKVVAYKKREKYGGINDIARPENAELMMIKLLSYFVVKGYTPHIVLPIGTFNTNINNFINLVDDGYVKKESKKYQDFLENYKKNYYHDQVSILISEWANRGDLLDFIRNNYREITLTVWKVFFFQILSVLAVIQYKYPTFRHNDLKANNILVQKVIKKGRNCRYTVNKIKYKLPNIGYQLKLWDFDFACIPGTINNAKVDAKWTNEINVNPVQNRYYDMHYFFNTLINKGFFPKFMTDDTIPKEAKEFVNRIVPPIYQNSEYVTEKGRILVNTEYLTPEKVLKSDVFFEEFRVTNDKLQIQSRDTKHRKKV